MTDGPAGVIAGLFLLVMITAMGFGSGWEIGPHSSPPLDTSRTYDHGYRAQPADERCVRLWNEATGQVAARRQLLGIQSKAIAIHVERLRNATSASGTCGIVFADKATGQTFATFASMSNGAPGYVDITGHASARMYGRAYAPAMVNAAMREDGTLVSVTPVSG